MDHTKLLAIALMLPLTACVADDADDLAAQESALSAEVATDLAATRSATAAYHDIDAAIAAGYADSGLPCIDGQGYHYIKGDLVGTFDVAAPPILVYFPSPSGDLRLVSLEWIQPIVDDTTARPELFGEHFHGPVSLEQLPFTFFALHVWAWKHNKDGMFAGKDPSLVCP